MELILISAVKLQEYIFGSNRLRENIGASYLVRLATEKWAEEILEVTSGRTLNVGGGKYAALFDESSKASEFIAEVSRRALMQAPGLPLRIAKVTVDDQGVRAAMERALEILWQQKSAPVYSNPQLGLGVTQACLSTGLAAAGYTPMIEEDPSSVFPASMEILSKLDVLLDANKSLASEIPTNGYLYPYDLDNLGRSVDENSYIAVVHVDGNGMGKRVRQIANEAANDDDYILRMQTFSNALHEASRRVLRNTVDDLAVRIHAGKIKHPYLSRLDIELKKDKKSGKHFLPLRPIVFGGDDITFVCDGRIGISLAKFLVEAFEKQTSEINLPGGRATACAGVAIVKAHYPFARAYALAEELTRKAKDYRLWICEYFDQWDGSCMDWHFAMSGLSGNLSEIRQREYFVPRHGHLHLRPVVVGANPYESERSLETILQGILVFQKDWIEHRNKTKALRQALREGDESVKKFKVIYRTELPEIQSYAATGWTNKRCGLFDALELADNITLLDQVEE